MGTLAVRSHGSLGAGCQPLIGSPPLRRRVCPIHMARAGDGGEKRSHLQAVAASIAPRSGERKLAALPGLSGHGREATGRGPPPMVGPRPVPQGFVLLISG